MSVAPWRACAIVLVVLAGAVACAGAHDGRVPPRPEPAPSSASEPAAQAAGTRLVVTRAWTTTAPPGLPTSCACADSAAEWRELRARLGTEAPAAPPCDFAVARVVAVWLHAAGVSPPIVHTIHSEEGVDVVVLEPAAAGDRASRTLLHTFVVPARPGQLAIVARLPEPPSAGAPGPSVERTLGVFAGR